MSLLHEHEDCSRIRYRTLREFPGEIRNRKEGGTTTVPTVALTDGPVSGFRPGSRRQMCVVVFCRSLRSDELRRRSCQRSYPVGSASANYSAPGRYLSAAGPRRNGSVADPVVFRNLPRPAIVLSLECRCRGNGIPERDPCEKGACFGSPIPHGAGSARTKVGALRARTS